MKDAHFLIFDVDSIENSLLYGVTWNSLVSLNVLMFAWRLFNDHLLIKDNFIRYKIYNLNYLMCGGVRCNW